MPEPFIESIFNYCDSWCERCAYRRRCRVFAMEQQMQSRIDQDTAKERDAGAEQPVAPAPATPPKRRRLARKHPDDPLLALAGRYMDNVGWFLMKHQHQRVPRSIAPMHKVVAWFHMFIYVKLTRATSSSRHERKVSAHESDANGSAKIALLGVEESMQAWSQIRDVRPKLAPYAARLIADLAKLRVLIEQRFPECRLFIRPGFDTHSIEEA